MTSSTYERDEIRLYLLGKLAGEDREKFEQRLLTDDELFEELLATEDELIDDFLTGDLSRAETERFEQHFLVTDERRQKLRLGKAFREYAAANPNPQPFHVPESDADFPPESTRRASPQGWTWSQLFSPSLLKPAAFAAVLLVAALGVWRIYFYQSDVDKGLIALNHAYDEQRPFEARISKFTYAPHSTTRGDLDRVKTLELDHAERYLRDAVRDDPGAASFYALGKFYLAKKDFDQAISLFDQALKADLNNAQIYADLGTALLEKGKREIERSRTNNSLAESGKGMEHWANSLKNFNKALELNHNLPEALFNRALLHELMALLPQAEQDWRKYLELDPDSKWADEARQKLSMIEEQLKKTSQTKQEIFLEFVRNHESGNEAGVWKTVGSYQNRAGNVVVEQLIDSYLEHVRKNENVEAEHALQRLLDVGNLGVRRVADRFFFDLAGFYQSATPEQRGLAVEARALMKKSFDGWGKLKVDENLNLFGKARKLFQEAGNFPESKVAEYWMSFCYFRQHAQAQSRQILDSLLITCENRGYIWLRTRGLYLLSAIEFDLNEHSKAVDWGLQAMQMAEKTNDSVGMLNATSALVEYYRYLGNYPKSLGCIQRSLPLVSSTSLDPVQGARHYSLAALAFSTTGLQEAAAGYQREALRFASDTGSDVVKAQNYAFLGTINGKLKNFSEALQNGQLALAIAQTLSTEPAGRGLLAYATLQMGNIYKDAGEFQKASEYYSEAIELYRSFPDFQTHLYQAHKGRLQCYLRQQNDPLAYREISLILDLMEKYRSQISDENNRNTFFEVEQSVFDAAIDFEYSRMKNPKRAFDYSNSSRARSLLDLLNEDKEVKARVQDPEIKFQSVSQSLPLERILQELPERAQILQYVVLEDKLLIWVISRNDFHDQEKQLKQKDLNERLLRYLNIISRPPKGNEAEELLLAKDLYTILIQPVESLLDKESSFASFLTGHLTIYHSAPWSRQSQASISLKSIS